LYRGNPFIQKLGRYILSTKNGWSANCRESDTKYYVFGVNSISKNSLINYKDLKTSDDQKGNIEEYFAKEGDLFISRGNTVDLVALASVAVNLPENKNIIFPDLFIRLEVNKEINKMYLAHLFNSIIGRYYFKYAAKGKNQTMVKVSSEELHNFYLPIPHPKMQKKIVDEIEAELDRQKEVKKKIETERNKITEIIEEESVFTDPT
jgi:type I restriction enzyme S subunit